VKPAVVIRGDALALPLASASVDLICTSPPYFGLRSYQDGGRHYEGQIGAEPTPAEFINALLAATREMVRVLKPSGSIFVNLGDKYAGSRMDGSSDNGGAGSTIGANQIRDPAVRRGQGIKRTTEIPTKSLMGIPWRYAIRCIDELGLILRAEIIWDKTNGLPESVTDRVRRSHETWFHFVTQPHYFSSIDPIREAHTTPSETRPRREPRLRRDLPGGMTPQHNGMANNALGRLPSSVWTIPTQPLAIPPELGIDHFAAYPMEWPRRIIQGWSPPGGVILDPFGGTGTTALLAKALGRIGITVDLSADYCRAAQWRTTDRGQLAQALQVEKPEPIPTAQMELF
jgi:site-specific DNA-methyltransferase (cytosine-N4-specific)